MDSVLAGTLGGIVAVLAVLALLALLRRRRGRYGGLGSCGEGFAAGTKQPSAEDLAWARKLCSTGGATGVDDLYNRFPRVQGKDWQKFKKACDEGIQLMTAAARADVALRAACKHGRCPVPQLAALRPCLNMAKTHCCQVIDGKPKDCQEMKKFDNRLEGAVRRAEKAPAACRNRCYDGGFCTLSYNQDKCCNDKGDACKPRDVPDRGCTKP